ncbi:MAG: zinc finger-like domain-containing protein [Epibacterium sp.]|nr:zinc finger-like domain-containing protein [Epibacterium sp.]NQX73724.1 hypothetical protein [Epibacterium sp.]
MSGEKIQCPYCDGAGYGRQAQKCDHCDGHGYLIEHTFKTAVKVGSDRPLWWLSIASHQGELGDAIERLIDAKTEKERTSAIDDVRTTYRRILDEARAS